MRRSGWWRGRRWIAFLAVAVAVVILTGVLVEGWRRRGLYRYDPATDYVYDFSRDASRFVPVELAPWGFVVPAGAAAGETMFLRLDLRPRVTSRWFEPWIEVVEGDSARCPQYFERGAAGRRWYLLCPAAGAAEGDTVRLRGHHAAWRAQQTGIQVFDAPDLTRVLVLAPHADDAEIAAFGLYADHDSWVVTITSGGYGGEKYSGLVPSERERHDLQARLRVWDSLTAIRLAGLDAARALNLGYPTTALEMMHASPDVPVPDPWDGSADIARWRGLNSSPLLSARPAVPSWKNLTGDLITLLDSIRPTAVVTPHPALDANRDHAFTTAALLEALGQSSAVPAHLLLYDNHHVWSEYYPFGPAYSHVTLPAWFDGATRFESVLSHPLSARRVLDKMFALDQMHDLREPPRPVTGGWSAWLGKRIAEAFAGVWRDPVRELSYFRRAVRPNELFFVYGQSSLGALRDMVRHASGEGPQYR